MMKYCPECGARIYELDKKHYPIKTYCCFVCEMNYVITAKSW